MKEKISSRLFHIVTLLLFFLMFVFPMVLELLYVKVFMFAFLLIIYSFHVIEQGFLPFHRSVLFAAGIMFLAGLFFFIHGMLTHTPGVFKLGQIYIVWPLIYVFLLSSIKDQNLLVGLEKTIVISTIILSLYSLSHFLVSLSILPKLFSYQFFKSEVIGFGYYNGYTEMTLPGINSIPFLIPFCITSLMYRIPENNYTPVKRGLIWIAVILGLITSFISARRAVWLVVLLTPFIIYFLKVLSDRQIRLTKKFNKKRFLFFVFMIIPAFLAIYFFVTSIYDFDLERIIKQFLSGFQFSTKNESERFRQYVALIHGWHENPLFGAGLGASAARYGSVRSSLSWSYELFYVSLLFQVGIVGFSLYLAGVLWIYHWGVKMMRSNAQNKSVIVPYMVAMTTTFIAGGTNPIFIRFDGLWFFFLPVAILNIFMLRQKVSVQNK